VLALFTARPYAGSWNDGSRLATVESLVDRGTFQIDDSVYVHPETSAIPAYTPGDDFLAKYGTKDKMFIDGHFYSDKSPVPAVLMAGAYQVLRWCGLPPASERPDWFARIMAWFFAGLPYVLAVWCIGSIARHIGLTRPWDLILTATFAFGSLALPYSQFVNNHVLLLGVTAMMCETMFTCPLAEDGKRIQISVLRAIWLGALAGFAYSIDLGAGPLLAACVGAWLLWHRTRVLWYVLGAIPLFVAHHWLNYAISGTLAPGNSNPEHFNWPGSPFNAQNMTGSYQHPSIAKAILYTLDLQFGRKGLMLYSLPLIQTLAGSYWLFRYRTKERSGLIALIAWSVGTWLLYATTSRNLSGYSISIRWFVPLIVPGFIGLFVLVRDYPRSRKPLIPLLAGALMMNIEFVARGPWSPRIPWLLWPVAGLAIITWVIMWVLAARRWWRERRAAKA
jgi:hypothetical protein